jgi:2-polyprenyl-3-methyl-5-hydroxy-6-metoxy-1,4-benzoquinol methylase
MKELDFINAKLGGHKITLDGIRILMNQAKKRLNEKNPAISILEIGCGGGDNLRVIKNYIKSKNIPAWLSGVDINPHCIKFARSRKENQDIQFVVSDYKLFRIEQKPDIIFCSLFCHHFTDEQVIEILKWMKENSVVGFFINDLHRHPFAYYSIKWLAKLFSKSYLVKNDAPLSVLRGFKRKELEMFNVQCSPPDRRAGIFKAQLKWKWAFRWLLIGSHEWRQVI